jgi:hypothetical protein
MENVTRQVLKDIAKMRERYSLSIQMSQFRLVARLLSAILYLFLHNKSAFKETEDIMMDNVRRNRNRKIRHKI